jgi:hypothetical protein
MMLGTASTTYTAPGINSADSRAAQSGTTRVVTSDTGGNLATTDANSLVTSSSAFQGLQRDVRDLRHDVRDTAEGVAMALAMGGGGMTLPDDKWYAVSTNWGNFGGQNAIAISGVARMTQNTFFNGGVGVGAGQGTVGGRAGVTVVW